MNVVVTDRKFPERADPYGDVVTANGGRLSYHQAETESETYEVCRDADIVLTFKAPLTAAVIADLDRTEAIIRIGTGTDTINRKAATEQGITISNAPGYSRHEVAGHAIALMLAVARRIPEGDTALRESTGWGDRSTVNRMYEGTFGSVGLGRIARAAVPKARGFDMEVIAYDPYVPADVFDLLGVEKVSFEELLERSDCVSVHAPLTAETTGMFNKSAFARMNDDAVFVNTARGPIVDEAALVNALEAGELWGAGLDVFEIEPPVETPALNCERIVCSPHRAGRTPEARQQSVEAVRAELARALRGEHLENIVNPEVLTYADELHSPEY